MLTGTQSIGDVIQTILLAVVAIGYPKQSTYPRPRKLLEEVTECI
ncbi:hypothetical protein ACJDT4_06095 [Clostridium neuense]|uniref:Uncharacterized protein n=1 Tax=Clostridium neuense TaxID=1728934 RepID=A0ABW8TBW9_9CLOT